MSPSADVLALASAEFNIASINEGTTLTVKWRGKPVFIRHRTDDEIAKEATVPMSLLKDAQADVDRVKDPKWCVVLYNILFCCAIFYLLFGLFVQAHRSGHLHTSGLRAHLRRRRLQRLVLPLPRLSL